MRLSSIEILICSGIIIFLLVFIIYWKRSRIIKLRELSDKNIHEISEVQKKINDISRIDSVHDLIELGISHFEGGFAFDYATISLIDFGCRIVKSYASEKTKATWVNENQFEIDDRKEKDIVLEIIRCQAEEPIYVIGSNVRDNKYGISFENLNKDIFKEYEHWRFARVFVPILHRTKQYVSSDRLNVTETDRPDDTILGIIEVGFEYADRLENKHIENIIEGKFNKRKIRNTFLYADNFAQLYYKNHLNEKKDFLRNALAKISISNQDKFLSESLEMIIRKFSMTCGAIGHLDISSPIQLFNDKDVLFGYSDQEKSLMPKLNDWLVKEYEKHKFRSFEGSGIANRVISTKGTVLENNLMPNELREGNDEISCEDSTHYLKVNKKIRSEIGIPIKTPENNIIAVLILSSTIPYFFNKLHIALLEYFGRELGLRYLTSKRYTSLKELNRPINLFSRQILDNLVDQVANYFNTKNIVFWQRNEDASSKKNSFKLSNALTSSLLDDIEKREAFFLDDDKTSDYYLGKDINIGYTNLDKDNEINVLKISNKTPHPFLSKICKKQRFKSLILIPIPFSDKYEYLITVFSKVNLDQKAVEEYALEFNSSLIDKFEDALQVKSLFDILLHSKYGNDNELYKLIVETTLNLVKADVVGFIPINENKYLDIKNSYIKGEKWDKLGSIKSLELSKLVLKKGSQSFNSFEEINQFYEAHKGSRIKDTDFIYNAKINSVAGIRLQHGDLVFGVLMIEFLKPNIWINKTTKYINIIRETVEGLLFNNNTVQSRIKELKYNLEELNIEKEKNKNQILAIEEKQSHLQSLIIKNYEVIDGLRTRAAAVSYFEISRIIHHEIYNLFRDQFKLLKWFQSSKIGSNARYQKIIRDINGIKGFITELLEMTNFSELEREYIDINQEIIKIIRLLKQSKGLEDSYFDLKGLNKDVKELRWNKAEFDMIIYNIISNAIYELEEKGKKNPKIHISTDFEDRNYIIKIRDNGHGISADIIDRIFDYTFTTKEKNLNFELNNVSAGHGIGLYFVKQSLYNSKTDYLADIKVDSVLGEYAEFTITIADAINNIDINIYD